MTRIKSNIMSSRERAAIDARKAKALYVPPIVSYDAALGIIDRECEKENCRWYGVRDATGESVSQILARRIEADATSRKEARQWVLASIADGTFPRRQS